MAGSLHGDTEAQMSQESGVKRGGWIAFPFIMGTLAGMTITTWGLLLNLIVFLINVFNVKSIAAAQISNILSGFISMFPVLGAVLADSFFGTFSVISASTFISLLGIVLLTLTASLDSLHPQPCEAGSTLCTSASKLQFGILYTGLTLACLGSGGTRFTLATIGANQFDKIKDQDASFNWFFFTTYGSSMISAIAIVYAEDNVSWKVGFGLCIATNLFSLIIFLSGKQFYRLDKPQGSPYSALFRVVVAAIHKRKVMLSPNKQDYYHETKGTDGIAPAVPTKSFRFLNRAALKAEGDTETDGSISRPWRLCSVQQVEDFKAVVRILPILSAILFLSTPIAIQMSMVVLQALAMDRHIGPHFQIPAGSMLIITLLSTCIFLTLNHQFLYPLYQKLAHKSLTPLQKVGIGHVLNILSMAVSAIVEAKRLEIVHTHHVTGSVAPMSALWLFPQLVIVGIGEAFHFPGNVGLCYQEFPASLRSTATAMTSVAIGICFYLSSALIGLIQKVTAWLPNDINHGRVDNVYWFLVIGGIINFGFFLSCACLYKYRNVEEEKAGRSSTSNMS